MDLIRTQEFAISALLPPAQDQRDRSTPEYREWLGSLSADIKERGIRSPLLLMPRADKLEVLAGETRRQAAMLAGLQKVPGIILERALTLAEIARERLLENEMRSNLSPLERARIYGELMRLNGWSQAELARAVFVTTGYVSKTLAIFSKLPDPIREKVANGTLCPTAAYHLTRVKDPAAMTELAEKLEKGLLTRDSVGDRVTRMIGKRKANEKPIKISVPGAVVTFTELASTKMEAALAKIDAGIKKAVKHGLPMTSLPSILKGGDA